MSDETRLTPTFAIEPRPGDPGRYTLVKRVDPVLAVGSDAGTLADVRALGEALVAFAARPTGDRRPAEGWRETCGGAVWVLDIGKAGDVEVFTVPGGWTWWIKSAARPGADRTWDAGDLTAAMLAAEDHARALLLAGLRVLDGGTEGP